MNIKTAILIVCLGCIHNAIMYTCVVQTRQNKKKTLSAKQKAYILSIRSAVVLFFVSIGFNILYWKCGTITQYKHCIADSKDLTFVSQLAVLFFTSHLLTDCIIGKLDYPENMLSLSGYPHHFVYIVLNIIVLTFDLVPEYLLFFLAELPTTILSIGMFDKQFRSDTLFGTTFILTRLLYHTYLIYITESTTVKIGGLIILCLHIFWFWKWTKQQLKMSKNNGQKEHQKHKTKTSTNNGQKEHQKHKTKTSTNNGQKEHQKHKTKMSTKTMVN
jgi:hypothetical protein